MFSSFHLALNTYYFSVCHMTSIDAEHRHNSIKQKWSNLTVKRVINYQTGMFVWVLFILFYFHFQQMFTPPR